MKPHLRWIQKTKYVSQAHLKEPRSLTKNTPEHFYHNEMEVRTSLLERARVRGLVKEK